MKISVPSYVIPGTYAENVRYLADKDIVGGIELLFFMYDDDCRELFLKEIDVVKEHSTRFEYTLHMPDFVLPEHESIIEMVDDFVEGYVIHPPAIPYLQEGESYTKEQAERIESFSRLMEEWIGRYGRKFRIENLIRRDMRSIADRVDALDICLDSGHCEMRNESPYELFKSYKKRVKEIHFHGIVEDGGTKKDHQGRFYQAFDFQKDYGRILKEYSGLLNLEVFSWKDVENLYYTYIMKNKVEE